MKKKPIPVTDASEVSRLHFAKRLYPSPKPFTYVDPNLKVIRLLRNTAKQLRAMNASPAHAESWIEPCSKASINRAKQLEKAAEELAS